MNAKNNPAAMKSAGSNPSRRPEPAVVPDPPRRSFLAKLFAVGIGGLVTLVPLGAGLGMLLNPLRSRGKSTQTKLVRVTTLDALPDDGIPRQFPVIVDTRDDAWNRYHHEPIGSVFLRREPGQQKPQALSAVCPHLGCFVSYDAARTQFQCPCHSSAFKVDGARATPCVALRPMDELEVELALHDGKQEVLVNYQDFFTGLPEKKAKS